MKKKPTIHDVAEHAGVSSTTVSRVLNNRGYISDSTRSKVWASIEELHYTPNELARSLYKKRTNTIGLVFPTVMEPYYAEIIFHLESELAKRNYRVLLCNSAFNRETERKHLQMLKERQVDGAIVEFYNPVDDVSNLPYPIVSIGKKLDPGIPAVISAYAAGGELAVAELTKSGASNLVCILDKAHRPLQAKELAEGYRKAVRKRKLKEVVYEMDTADSVEARKKQLLSMFEQHPGVDGLFVTNDETALLVLQLASQREKKVPDDLRVIGYGGTKLMASFCDELTTVKEPIEELARSAVDVLLKNIETDRADRKTTIVPITLQSKFSTNR